MKRSSASLSFVAPRREGSYRGYPSVRPPWEPCAGPAAPPRLRASAKSCWSISHTACCHSRGASRRRLHDRGALHDSDRAARGSRNAQDRVSVGLLDALPIGSSASDGRISVLVRRSYSRSSRSKCRHPLAHLSAWWDHILLTGTERSRGPHGCVGMGAIAAAGLATILNVALECMSLRRLLPEAHVNGVWTRND